MEQHKKTHPAENVLLAFEAILLAILAYRNFVNPQFMDGQLLPCLTLALAPGSALRLAGLSSLSAHRFGVAGGLVVFMISNGSLKFDAVAGMLARWEYLVPALILVCMQPLMGSGRWLILMRARELELSYAQALRLVLVGFFFNNFIPGATGGDLFRAYYVAKGKGKTGAAITSIVLDRFTGLPPLVFLVVVAAAANWNFVESMPHSATYITVIYGMGGGSLILLGAVLFGGKTVRHLLVTILNRLGKTEMAARIEDALDDNPKHVKSVFKALGISLFSHTTTIIAGCLLGVAAGLNDVPVQIYFIIIPLGLAVNAVPLTPGGVGQGEGAFFVLFAAASQIPESGAAGAAIMLGLRMGIIICGMAGGLLYALGHHDIDSAAKEAEDAASTENTTDALPSPQAE